MTLAAHLDLDGAWGQLPAAFARVDATAWGPKLRYWARGADLDRFYEEVIRPLPPLVVYGSGDFHHLAAKLALRFGGPLTIVSFDNHPDWDVRPPPWSCGCWVNRALEQANVEQVHVWGCGNFELAFPSRVFRNRRRLREGRLYVHGWAERYTPAVCRRFDCVSRENWQERFEAFASSLRRRRVYVTVDMDCLNDGEAVTNWEQGLFAGVDLAWAIGILKSAGELVGADVCGAASEGVYERPLQRFAAWWDHPKLKLAAAEEARRVNRSALEMICAPLGLGTAFGP